MISETIIAAGDSVLVAGADLDFRHVPIGDSTPTGHQIAHAAGCKPPKDAVVMRVLPDGEMVVVRPDETVDLRQGDLRFVAVIADRVSFLAVDGERYEWPGSVVSGAVVRRLASVPADHTLLLERVDKADREISPTDLVSLEGAGIESFTVVKKVWKLNVHGVVVEFEAPTVVVRDALVKAGIDPAKPWQIFLKVAGRPKVEVALQATIDLSTPGIEKLRLMPRAVDNGEARAAPRRVFNLLAEDVAYLDRLNLPWETIVEQQRRWLVVKGYVLPAGFTASETDIILEIPPTYPQAQIYGFYTRPALALRTGRVIPNTQMTGILDGEAIVGWSRYRPGQPWDPDGDNVATQFALIEAALAREAGE